MRNNRFCAAMLLATAFFLPSPVQALKAKQSLLAGWWGYDKECPASDSGFGLALDGRASDGSGVYAGRWSLRDDKVTIVWKVTESERANIKRSEWRIVENFMLARKPGERAMLVNIENRERVWLCRKYR